MAIENNAQNSEIELEITEDTQPEEILEELGVEVELPEEMNIQGDMTTSFEIAPDGTINTMGEEMSMVMTEHQANLAEIIEEDVLNTLSSELLSAYENDKESRSDWLNTFTKGLDLLGIKTEEREEPFPGATGVHHPLLSEAVTQFQAQAYKELLPPGGPVKTRIMGNETPPGGNNSL